MYYVTIWKISDIRSNIFTQCMNLNIEIVYGSNIFYNYSNIIWHYFHSNMSDMRSNKNDKIYSLNFLYKYSNMTLSFHFVQILVKNVRIKIIWVQMARLHFVQTVDITIWTLYFHIIYHLNRNEPISNIEQSMHSNTWNGVWKIGKKCKIQI